MNELTVFSNETFGNLRTIERNGEIWFVAKDVCDALEINNSRQALTRLEKDEKNTVILNDGSQNRKMATVNEYGLYTLVLSSRKPEAKDFKRWITHDVIPSIRKTGSYSVQQLPNFNNPAEAARAWADEYEAKLKAQEEIKVLQPKADFNDRVLNAEGLYTVTQIAKDFGLSAKTANQLLQDWHIQYKQSGMWQLYAEYQDKGYTMSSTTIFTTREGTEVTTVNTKWTNKGREFLVHVFEKHGYQLSSTRG